MDLNRLRTRALAFNKRDVTRRLATGQRVHGARPRPFGEMPNIKLPPQVVNKLPKQLQCPPSEHRAARASPGVGVSKTRNTREHLRQNPRVEVFGVHNDALSAELIDSTAGSSVSVGTRR